ncbi:MAG: dihydrolipoyl dehydrogenase [Bradymonadales bacterium]|nr:dihydrolipoyl dehydrogenase [Bradymonadales bacterium]
MVVGNLTQETEVVVIGAGPGGYVAAIRAADLGREVLLVEERESLGGVCLTEGCIPSKTLIHAMQLINAAREAERFGILVKEVNVDIDRLREFCRSVVSGLSRGVEGLLKRRGVEVIRGRARFESDRSLRLEGSDVSNIEFRHAIIATGSRINQLPVGYDLPLWSSAQALTLPEVPPHLLVIGGGYIGLEMGLVYAGLGSRVTLVEFCPRLLLGADPDLVEVVIKRCQHRFEALLVDSRVIGVQRSAGGYEVQIEHEGATTTRRYDQVLVAIGRHPNTEDLGLEKAGVALQDGGIIQVDNRMRTSRPHIYAIGDVAPGPPLAHKASREGKVAAEAIAGQPSAFDNRAIPAVVFTDPEIAWAGLTEREAERQGRPVRVGRFPLKALGRAWTMGQTDGLVKVISEVDSGLVLGVGMVGPHVSELISEASLALEMGATVEDLAVTIHPHPTIAEAIQEAAEVADGRPVHISPATS